MSPTRILRSLALFLTPVVVLPGLATAARAQGCSWCGSSPLCCPAPTTCITRTPRWHYKCVCPRPVCAPCNLEHYGYYPTCWQPWPFPPDTRHCDDHGVCMASPYAATLEAPTPMGTGPSPMGPMPRADQLPPMPKGTNGEELPRPRP
jgi:hypothetical protein